MVKLNLVCGAKNFTVHALPFLSLASPLALSLFAILMQAASGSEFLECKS